MTAVLKVAALVLVVAGGWAVLATLFTPPLTSGWREGMEALRRRWTLAVIVLGLGAGRSLSMRMRQWVPEFSGDPPWCRWASRSAAERRRWSHGADFRDVRSIPRVVPTPLRGRTGLYA